MNKQELFAKFDRDVAIAVKRNFSMIEDMKVAFNLTDEQIDDMFIEASAIK